MIRVMIESPFMPKAPHNTPEHAVELARNIAYAWDLVLDSLRRGEAPFASHLFYPNVLAGGDDRDPVERQLGIDAGTAWAQAATVIVVGTDLGVTGGTLRRLAALQEWANNSDVPEHEMVTVHVEYRSLSQWVGKLGVKDSGASPRGSTGSNP
jgi:hypothetical protein